LLKQAQPRYSRDDVDRILGRVLRRGAQSTSDDGSDLRSGLDEEDAFATVVEMGETLGLDRPTIASAFAEYAQEREREQQWLTLLGATPSAMAIGRTIKTRFEALPSPNNIRRAVRIRRSHRVVDPDRHAQGAVLTSALRMASPLYAPANRMGTEEAICLTIIDTRRTLEWVLGFIPWRTSRTVRVARVWIVGSGPYVLEGEIADIEVASKLGPVLADLEREFANHVERGRFEFTHAR
jgi:hypothetical protein